MDTNQSCLDTWISYESQETSQGGCSRRRLAGTFRMRPINPPSPSDPSEVLFQEEELGVLPDVNLIFSWFLSS